MSCSKDSSKSTRSTEIHGCERFQEPSRFLDFVHCGDVILRLYSALYDEFYPFDHFLPEWTKITVGPKDELVGPGALIIWGGSDIHPSLYLRDNVATWAGEIPSPRDQAEAKLFAKAVDAGLVILGVCRGAQLGCALSGGILIQDVSGHNNDHMITTSDDRNFATSSIHHQMMYPWSIEHELLAWTHYPKSNRYVGLTDAELEKIPCKMFGDEKELPIEPEVVWFPTTKCLAIQGHPEMMDYDCGFNRYIGELVKEKCA